MGAFAKLQATQDTAIEVLNRVQDQLVALFSPTASTGCAASCFCNLAQALTMATSNLVIFNVIDYDTDAALTVGGGAFKFTCPTAKSGKYHLSAGAGVSVASPGEIFLSAFVNGLEKRRGNRVNVNTTVALTDVQLGTDLLLNAGDTVDARVFISIAGATLEANSVDTYFTIHRLAGV